MPLAVAGIAGGELPGDGEAVAVAGDCGGGVALRRLDVADPVIADRQVALPLAVAGIAGGELPGDGEAVAVAGERGGGVALRRLDIADLVVADREVALPLAVAGIAGGELLADGEAVAVAGERGGGVALCRLDVADLVVADRQVALPLAVVGIAGGELPGHFNHGTIIGQGAICSAENDRQVPCCPERLEILGIGRGSTLRSLEGQFNILGLQQGCLLQVERSRLLA